MRMITNKGKWKWNENLQDSRNADYWTYFFIIIFPFITKTRLYKFDPLKPHFYIVKLGFTGVYIIFLILQKT